MEIKIKYWKSEDNEDNFRGNKITIFDYPNNDQFLNLEQNTGYCYVSSTYLNGLVNYVDHLYLICSQVYRSDEEFDKIIEYLEGIDLNAKPCEWYHTNLEKIEDNTYLIGENKSSYLLFCYDVDCSDCMIIRFNKEDFNFNQVKEYCLSQARYESFRYDHKNPKYIELPKPQGWIKG